MLNLKFETLRARAYKANLPESQLSERYNLSFSHRRKDGTYDRESWLAELPKGTVLEDGTLIEIRREDLGITNGYSKNKKKQFAPSLRVYKFTVLKSKNSDTDEFI